MRRKYVAQKFDSVQHFRIAATLFMHDNYSKRTFKSIVKEIFRDAIEFSFRNGTNPCVYLQKIIEALEELKKEYETKE